MTEDIKHLSRREFAKTAALMTTASVLAPSELLSQEQKSTTDKATQQAPQAPKLSPASQAEADAAYETLMRKYGSRFSEEQKTEIRRLVHQQQAGLDKLRAVTVTNSDEPATIFQILVDRREAK